jgi:hypothetical protein
LKSNSNKSRSSTRQKNARKSKSAKLDD